MSVHYGLPKDAKEEFKVNGSTQYSLNGKWIYEFGEWKTIAGEWQQVHSNYWYESGDIIFIYKGLLSKPSWSESNEPAPEIPEKLIACLKHIKEALLKDPDIHVGWYAKHTDLQFVYDGKIYEINPRTLDFDEIDFGPASDWDKEHYTGGGVGNADAYFEHNDRIMRAMLSEELGVEFFHSHGFID